MCGIVYQSNLLGGAVAEKIAKTFKDQRHRGVEGFGFYMPQSNTLVHNVKEGRTLRLLEREKAPEILFHHRKPTSSKNKRNQCHPFTTKNFFGDTQYIMVHNGAVRNAFSLKAQHEELGVPYVSEQGDTFNDSESLLWDLALHLEGKKDFSAYGAIAFIMVKLVKGKPVKLLFGRNNERPLNFMLLKTGVHLSSEGDGDSIPCNTLYTYNYRTNTVDTEAMQLPVWNWSTKDNYDPTNKTYRDDVCEVVDDASWRMMRQSRLYQVAPKTWGGYSWGLDDNRSYCHHNKVITRDEYIDRLVNHLILQTNEVSLLHAYKLIEQEMIDVHNLKDLNAGQEAQREEYLEALTEAYALISDQLEGEDYAVQV